MDELRLERLEPELLLDHVLGEVAGVLVQVEVFHLDDPGDHRVEELPVVRDDDRGAAVVAEPVFEPFDAGHVEVVGGLVQQQDVRTLQQDLGQGGAVAPPAGEFVDRAGAVGVAEPQRGQDCVDAPRVIPSVEAVHILEQLGLAPDQPVQLRSAGSAAMAASMDCQLGLGGLDLDEQSVQDLRDGCLPVQLGKLGEVPHPGSLFHGDGSGFRGDLVKDQLEDGGLAGTVLADEAHPVAGSRRKYASRRIWVLSNRTLTSCSRIRLIAARDGCGRFR